MLNHQIEQFDPLLGIALIWIDVPSVSAAGPQQLWMYYGNAKAPASGNGQRTFDPDYTLVYHFAEGSVPARDTTAYGNHSQTAVVSVDGTVIGKGAKLKPNKASMTAVAWATSGSPLLLTVSSLGRC